MKLCWDTATAVRPRAISGCFRLQQYLADRNGYKRDVGRTAPARIYCGALDSNDTARTTHRTKRTKVEDHSLGDTNTYGTGRRRETNRGGWEGKNQRLEKERPLTVSNAARAKQTRNTPLGSVTVSTGGWVPGSYQTV